jgi:hypothetical protein
MFLVNGSQRCLDLIESCSIRWHWVLGIRYWYYCLPDYFHFITALVETGSSAQVVDNTIYTELLGKYVKDGVVDYEGFKNV